MRAASKESSAITIRMMPVISAFCSPDSGVLGGGAILGWGLWVVRVVFLVALLLVLARLEDGFLVAPLLEGVEVERGFAVVLALVAVFFVLVVRVAINSPHNFLD